MVWSDDFGRSKSSSFTQAESFTSVDTSKWNVHNSCAGNKVSSDQPSPPPIEGADGCTESTNVEAKNGFLHLKATQDGANSFTAASVSTYARNVEANKGHGYSGKYGAWKYGRWDIRAKMPRGEGVTTVFRLLPSSSHFGAFPKSGGIDFVHHEGGNSTKSQVSGKLHFAGVKGRPSQVSTREASFACISDFSAKFYEFSVVWTPESIGFYVDGMLYHREEGKQRWWGSGGQKENHYNRSSAPFDQRMWLNIEVRKSQDSPLGDGNDNLTIDYVRVYQSNHVTGGDWTSSDWSKHRYEDQTYQCQDQKSKEWKICKRPVTAVDDYSKANAEPLYEPTCAAKANAASTNTAKLCAMVVQLCTTKVALFCSADELACFSTPSSDKRYAIADAVFQRNYQLAGTTSCSQALGGLAKLQTVSCPEDRCFMLPDGVTQDDYESWSSYSLKGAGFGIAHTLDVDDISGKDRVSKGGLYGGSKTASGDEHRRKLLTVHPHHDKILRRLAEFGSLNSFLQQVVADDATKEPSTPPRKLADTPAPKTGGSSDAGTYTSGDQKRALDLAGALLNGTQIRLVKPMPEFEFPPLYATDTKWGNGICQDPIDLWTLALGSERGYEFDFAEQLDDLEEQEQTTDFTKFRLRAGEKMILSNRYHHDCMRFHHNTVNAMLEADPRSREIDRDPYKYVFKPLYAQGGALTISDKHPSKLNAASFSWGSGAWAIDMRVNFGARSSTGAQSVTQLVNWGPVKLYRAPSTSSDPLYSHYKGELLLDIRAAGRSNKMLGPKLSQHMWQHLVVQYDGSENVTCYLSPGGPIE
jgi:beta-glucanase (GH16 family)